MKQVDAAAYVGMCDKTFRKIVMPHVPKIPIFEPRSKNSPVEIFHYDRIDLDSWIDDLKRKKLTGKTTAQITLPVINKIK
ncbi:hypothetical protein [Chromobacterium subtsugae]|uniref:hypothetical protein n=1 Tax=Chromobacterium subtsugae TaxID=251747 RepID=UPI0012FF7F86|nr:hypothetical protein [Chromobacterium subtsugae]